MVESDWEKLTKLQIGFVEQSALVNAVASTLEGLLKHLGQAAAVDEFQRIYATNLDRALNTLESEIPEDAAFVRKVIADTRAAAAVPKVRSI